MYVQGLPQDTSDQKLLIEKDQDEDAQVGLFVLCIRFREETTWSTWTTSWCS